MKLNESSASWNSIRLTKHVEQVDLVAYFGKQAQIDKNSSGQVFHVFRILCGLICVKEFITRQNQTHHCVRQVVFE